MSFQDALVIELAKRLDYTFTNLGLLEVACVHRSFGNEQRSFLPIHTRDNEQMEFLGDAVLDLIVSHLLVESFQGSTEGELSKFRAGLVNEKSLAKFARALKLGEYLKLGKGEEQTDGRNKDSILASTLEAIIAAIYLDGGFPAADAWVRALFADAIESARKQAPLEDHKTRLQELSQARFRVAPVYLVTNSTGPDHDKTFQIQLSIGDKVYANASGKSKKEAEQSAACIALEKLRDKLES